MDTRHSQLIADSDTLIARLRNANREAQDLLSRLEADRPRMIALCAHWEDLVGMQELQSR